MEIRNEESCLKAKVFGQKKDSQFLGFLSLPILLSLFTSKSTKVYRTLKDKALKRTQSRELKISFKYRLFERQE